MQPAELLAILHQAEKLKCNTRHCYTSSGRHESVAEHSWRISLMAMLLRSEFPEADMDKVVRMCLIHDLGESFTGDIPAFLKTGENETAEDEVLRNWFSAFPSPEREELLSLWDEMEALETQEAKIYKALDKTEALLQHDESDLATWLPLEFDLQLTYGRENMAFSPYFQALRAEIDALTRRKIDEYREKTEIKEA